MVHHCNEKIQKHDDVYDREGAKHDQTPKPCELLDSSKFEIVKVDKTKCGPKQCLCGLPKTVNGCIFPIKSYFDNTNSLCEFPIGEAVVYLDNNLVVSFKSSLIKETEVEVESLS